METNLKKLKNHAILYYYRWKNDEEKSIPRTPWSKEQYEEITLGHGSTYEEYIKRFEENKDGEFDKLLCSTVIDLTTEKGSAKLKEVTNNSLFHSWLVSEETQTLINSIINKI
jgi:hypothetical protein